MSEQLSPGKLLSAFEAAGEDEELDLPEMDDLDALVDDLGIDLDLPDEIAA